jgi:hypothetical protein
MGFLFTFSPVPLDKPLSSVREMEEGASKRTLDTKKIGNA